MLNVERIKLMRRAAAYEAGEGKKTIPINQYFRGDYISINLIWGWICYTIAFGLCIGLWAVYKMEYLMEKINTMDLVAFARFLILIYAVGMIVYMGILYFYYSWKYKQNRKSLARYYKLLKELSELYNTEGKNPGNARTSAGGIRDDEDFIGD